MIKLDPDMPERLQLDQMVKADPIYERLMPELCVVAEQAFLGHPGMRRIKLRGPKLAAEPGSTETANAVQEVSPGGSATLGKGLRVSVPICTPLLDPRHPSCHGDPVLLAQVIGVSLANHVAIQLEMLESKAGRLDKWRTEVKVFGQVPLARCRADASGKTLGANCPMLKGRVDLILSK